MDMSHDLSFEDLADYVEGRLDGAEAARLEAHLACCEQCRADVAWLRRTLGLMAGDRLVDAPQRAVRRAQALYRAPARRPSVAAMRPGLWHGPWAWRLRLVAVPVLVVLLICSAWAWGEGNVAQAATLAEVQGPVEVLLPGEQSWQAALPGVALSAGCAVRAGEGGLATILYADGSHSTLAERAEVRILELSGPRNRGRTTVCLAQTAGHTQHQVQSPGSSLRVQAGEAEVEASAAIYDVWVSGGDVDVVANRGQVTLKSGNSESHMAEGEYGHVAEGAPAVISPKPVPTAAAHGRDKPKPTPHEPERQETRAPQGKPHQTLGPPDVTPAAREGTPPGKGRGKENKPRKTKVPRGR